MSCFLSPSILLYTATSMLLFIVSYFQIEGKTRRNKTPALVITTLFKLLTSFMTLRATVTLIFNKSTKVS